MEYPIFTKSKYHYYKVFDSADKYTSAIQVFNGYIMSIDIVSEDLALKETESITESEFLEAYNEVASKLEKLVISN